jgi:hypothetical protein
VQIAAPARVKQVAVGLTQALRLVRFQRFLQAADAQLEPLELDSVVNAEGMPASVTGKLVARRAQLYRASGIKAADDWNLHIDGMVVGGAAITAFGAGLSWHLA